MRFKRVIAGVWTAALLSGAAALASDSGVALRLSALPAVPKLQAPQQQTPALRAAGSQMAKISYEPSGSFPALRPSILDDMAAGGSAQVQLGAYRAEAAAAEDWDRLAAGAKGLLDGLTPEIVSADLPGRGRFYRLRVGPLGDGGAADALCARLKERGLACIPVKG